MIDLDRKVSVRQLVVLASWLVSDASAPNAEYDRALTELVTDAAGLSMDEKKNVARLIGAVTHQ